MQLPSLCAELLDGPIVYNIVWIMLIQEIGKYQLVDVTHAKINTANNVVRFLTLNTASIDKVEKNIIVIHHRSD